MPPRSRDLSVDRLRRNRSSSPESRRSRPGRRSPSPATKSEARGIKRGYRDDRNDNRGYDGRRFRLHYEEAISERRRPSRHYDDVDKGRPSSDVLSYDEQGPLDKRRKTRSRSPTHHRRDDHNGGNRRETSSRYGSRERVSPQGLGIVAKEARHQSVSKRGQYPLPTDGEKRDAKLAEGHISQHGDDVSSTERQR